MKIRVTLMTENDIEPSGTKEETEKIAKKGWDAICGFLNLSAKPNETITLEKVELVEE